jgi:hypothetical protein
MDDKELKEWEEEAKEVEKDIKKLLRFVYVSATIIAIIYLIFK